jgi:hypothetical protein
LPFDLHVEIAIIVGVLISGSSGHNGLIFLIIIIIGHDLPCKTAQKQKKHTFLCTAQSGLLAPHHYLLGKYILVPQCGKDIIYKLCNKFLFLTFLCCLKHIILVLDAFK